jgi:acyl-CoA synthetase (AMP-forming)/AMP-acid ligase II/acyl carrier protein
MYTDTNSDRAASNGVFEVAPIDCPDWLLSEHTLVDVVRFWARMQPSSTAYLYVASGREQSLSFGQLDRRARAIAHALRRRQERGTRALLFHGLGLEFVEGFFGCLYAGIIAVPMHPGRGKSGAARASAVARDCGARTALTSVGLRSHLAELARGEPALASLEILETDAIAGAVERTSAGVLLATSPSDVAPADVAFLQYTSGSTSQPKGTIVTHRNIMANQAMLREVFQTDRATVIASWLPIFHDMGLIGNVLQAAYLGVPAILLSTLGFIKSPISWLRAIAQYKATFSGAPNFAYDLCVAKTTPEERVGLDLRGWRVAFNGAEPVRHRTLEAFLECFEPYGFRREALVPTYGLAEATLVVSGSGARGLGPRYFSADARKLKQAVVESAERRDAAQTLVSNGGFDRGDQHIAVVDPETLEPCSPARVGEIWISGSHVARGYWQKEAVSQATFGAMLSGDPQRYLRTGDLGFVRDGELFVTGRLKDLIIFRGQNIYPQDIELTVETAAPEVRPGCTVAFSVDRLPAEGVSAESRGTDGSSAAGDELGIVVVAELERRDSGSAELLARIAERVQEQHEIPLLRLLLVGRNTVPKTTSGKIQRQKCKQEYLCGAYAVIGEWRNPGGPPASELRDRVMAHAAVWIARSQNLPVESIEFGRHWSAFGLDSIRKVELVQALEERFGIVVPESNFFALESIADLGKFVATSGGSATSTPHHPNEPPSKATEPGQEPVAAARRSAVVLPTFSNINFRGAP